MRGDHVAWQKFVATLRLLPWRSVWRSGEISRSGLLMESRPSMEVGAMAIEDRRDVSIVEERHGLIGNSLATDVPPFLVNRFELLDPLQRLLEPPLVDDADMLAMMRGSYFALINNVRTTQELLLGPTGEALDEQLAAAGLSRQLLALKTAGFRRELSGVLEQTEHPRRKRWFHRAAKWANIVLGSLASVPIIGPVVEPLREFKESVETQIQQETES